jgi:hypothetical protein
LKQQTNILTQNCCTPMQLQKYLSNALPAIEAREVEEHFTACAMCSDAIDALSMLGVAEQNNLIQNENPFLKQNPSNLTISYKKSRILQIASAILLLVGIGFGAKLLLQPSNEKTIATISKPSNITVDDNIAEKTIADKEVNTIENKTADALPATAQSKQPESKPTSNITTIDANSKADCITDDAEKQRIAQYKLEKNKIVPPASAPQPAVKVVEAAPIKDNYFSNDEASKPSADKSIVAEEVAATKVVVAAKAERKKTENYDVVVSNQSTEIGGGRAAKTTYIVDGILKQPDQKDITQQIISAYQQKKYANVIYKGNMYLASKNPAFVNTVTYYVGASYAATNDKENAIKMLQSIDSKSEFYKQAQQLLSDLKSNN